MSLTYLPEHARATLLALDDARREKIGKLQAAQERRNAASKEIGRFVSSKRVLRGLKEK